MTLWILFCRMTKDVDTLFIFYASDQEQAEEILKQYPYERLELKAFPNGFRMVCTHIPGVIERDVV